MKRSLGFIRIILPVIVLLTGISSFAQYNNPPATYNSDRKDNNVNTDNNSASGGFKKENIFLGGSLQLGYGANTFSVGGNPEIGYTIAQWLDAGVAFNLIYTAQSADPTFYYNDDIRLRNFNYGAGVFLRAYPVPFLFLELQPEANWIHESAVDYAQGGAYSATFQSTSLIAGIGYTQRIVGQGSFFTLIGLDLLDNPNSPYREINGDGSTSPIPIIRAGFDFYLHPSRK